MNTTRTPFIESASTPLNAASIRSAILAEAEEPKASMLPGDTPRETFEEMWRTLNQGEIWRGHFVNRRKDGSIFVENKMISAISDDEGKVQYYLSIGEDFSQHHHYRQ